jgi:hypothetical protein
MPWFEVVSEDETELSPAEHAFLAALRAHCAAWDPTESSETHIRSDVDGSHTRVIAFVSLIDEGGPGERGVVLMDAGVHLLDNRVQGDRLDSQDFTLPERPSSWALAATGTPDELAAASAVWFRHVLERPIVLYVWIHDGYAYANRYDFADTGEPLCQSYNKRYAPPGQVDELMAASHVSRTGWVQTTGLPTPTTYIHIRGDFTKGAVLPGVQAATRRGPSSGLWEHDS